MNKANLWFYFCYCTGNNKAMPKAWAVFVSAAFTSSISPGDFYLKHSDSQTIKTRGGQGHIICLVLQWRLWLWWWMFHDLNSGEWDTDHIASGWKENCPAFPRLPWAMCCRALTSAAVNFCELGLVSVLKKWLFWQGCSFYQQWVWCSQIPLKNHSTSSCK